MQPMPLILRGAFAIGSVVFLGIGLYVFAFAESVATLPANVRGGNPWPWPLGPLLMRFIATFSLVGTVGCFLVAWRPNAATVTAFGSLGAIFAALLLLHSALNWGNINWTRPVGVGWLVLLGVGLVAAVALAFLGRRRARQTTPALAMPADVRWITIFLLLLNAVVGATLFFVPELGRRYWPWELSNSVNVQLLGAVFLGGALTMLWVWRQASWYGYDILFASVGTFSTLALIASFMHWNLFQDRLLISYVFVALYAVGAVMGFYAFIRHNRRPVALTAPDRAAAVHGV